MRRLWIGAVIFAVATATSARGATTVWIDTDPSIGAPWREVDDAFALLLAFHSPELRIAGISTTYGNAGLALTSTVARDLVQRFGAPANLSASDVHAGAKSAGQQTATEASDALAAALRKGKLTYLALGPLTNLAASLRLHPELAPNIERVIFVGGHSQEKPPAFGPRGSFRIHDANVFKDPAAVATILHSRLRVTLTPVQLASQLALTPSDIARLRGSGAAGDFLYRKTRAWLWFWTRIVHEKGGLPFDAMPVMAAIRPELLETETGAAQLNDGRELIAQRKSGRRVEFCTGVNAGAKPLLLQRLRGGAPHLAARARRPIVRDVED